MMQTGNQPVSRSTMYVAVLETEGYIVGGDNAAAGVYRRDGDGSFLHLGWPNVRGFGVAASAHRPQALYFAAGNGILRSLDGGTNWRQLADWRITEVEDAALDPHNPDAIYLATSNGPWRSLDGGQTWSHLIEGIPAPRSTFAQAIAVDVASPGVVIVGTECGLYRSEDGGDHWATCGPRVAIRDLHQSAAVPGLWLAGSDGAGVLISTNGGRDWSSAGGELRSSTIWAVATTPIPPYQRGERRDIFAAAGYNTGVYLSENGGRVWRRHPASFPDNHVHALAFDPDEPGRLWAGTVGGGVWYADRGADAWSFAGLPGATVWDILLVNFVGGDRSFVSDGPDFSGRSGYASEFSTEDLSTRLDRALIPPRDRTLTPPLHRAPTPLLDRAPTPTLSPRSDYQERCDAIIDFYANRDASGYIDFVEFIEVAARLYRDQPVEDILPLLDPLLDDPRGDVFFMYPLILICYLGDERLPESYRRRLRDLWRTYAPYRGDTENHWVMYYASLYLAAQLYPAEPGDSWFNGRSSDENSKEATEWLELWVDLTTTRGQGEYDSPHYLPFFVTPMALLYAFARDADMRKRAGMMLDYLIADFAADTLDGLYVGAFSRIYPEPALERWRNGSTTLAWLLFGNVPFRPDGINVILPMPGYRPHGVGAILAMSGYVPNEILVQIATDRRVPYVHRELKRTRHRIRHSDIKNVPVYKYVYMTDEYALGSTQGGLLQPVQQHTWELFWRTEDPHEGFNVFFSVHPYSSPYELAMYFPEEPQLMTEAVLKGKKETYDSPDKWTGGSPHEQVFQHRSALIALYDIAENTRFPHVSAYFSRNLDYVEEDGSGWIFCRGGNALIACYPIAPYLWRDEPGGDVRLHCPHLKTGFVVQVASASEFGEEDFRTAVRTRHIETTCEPVPSVTYETFDSDIVFARYGETPSINGIEVDFDSWPLFDGPFMQAERDGGRLELRHGGRRRIMDFRTLTVNDHGPVPVAP